ncbi:hypothetical protein LCGC14_1265870 [marine sediment metagenome]|uniref:Uncharacterized protein n=1 Tax=marine sediment metagenome TaxID=412755 RepID=A0A0F9P2R0_9ZZZZ
MPYSAAKHAWTEKNRERLKVLKHLNYLQNRDKYLASSKARRERNPVATQEYNTRWRAKVASLNA